MHALKSALPLIVYLAGCIAVAQPAIAADAAPPSQAKRSADDFIGERISFPVDIEAHIYGTKQKVCLPANTGLRGLGKSNGDGLLVQPAQGLFRHIEAGKERP